MMSKPRVNVVTIIVGDRGTGKTTFLKGDPALQIPGKLPRYVANNSKVKILVVDTFDNPMWRHYPLIEINQLDRWSAGPARIFSSDTDELLHAISVRLHNAVVVFEDATKFIGSRLNKDTKRFILDSKQKNLDLYFIFHYLMAIPADLSRVSDIIVMFKTKELFSPALRSKFPNPSVEYLFNKVQKAKSPFYCDALKISG